MVYAFIDAANLFYGGEKSLLKKKRKKIHILARSERTAKEIRQLAGPRFMDFTYIRKFTEFEPK